MKIKLRVRQADYERVADELRKHGIEISDEADFILSNTDGYSDWLSVRSENEQMHIKTADIVFIESFGHNILVHTDNEVYHCTERLFRLEQILDQSFMRISNSVIISKKNVIRIRTGFSQKFTVTLSDGSEADVTRSYYYAFKKEFGI